MRHEASELLYFIHKTFDDLSVYRSATMSSYVGGILDTLVEDICPCYLVARRL